MARKSPPSESQSPPASQPSPENGAGPSVQTRQPPRRIGVQAALNRASSWRKAHPPLSADQDALLAISARLYCHAVNLSNRLYFDTELRQDGEPRQALKLLLDLDQRITENLQQLFGDDGDGDLSSLFRKKAEA